MSRIETREITYYFSCGCVKDHVAKLYSRSVCPDHPKESIVVKREAACCNCGKLITASPSGGIPELCPACKKEFEKERQKSYKDPFDWNGISRHSAALPPKRKSDCRYYAKCLAPGGRLLENDSACIGCPYYEKKELDITQFIANNNFSIHTKHKFG